jgi:hypothetical protein
VATRFWPSELRPVLDPADRAVRHVLLPGLESPSGPVVSKVELVPTRSWLKVVACGSGTRAPSTWKLKR